MKKFDELYNKIIKEASEYSFNNLNDTDNLYFSVKDKDRSNQDCESFINDLITKHFLLLKFSISQELKILLKDENEEAYDYLKTIYESDDQTLKDFVINDLEPYFKQNWNKKDLEDIREFARETIDLYLKDKFKD